MLTFEQLQTVNASRCERWHPGFIEASDRWSIADWSNATQGEVGELAEAVLTLLAAITQSGGLLGNMIKKIRRIDTGESAGIRVDEQDRPGLLSAVFDEAADVVTYLDLLITRLGGSLGLAVIDKFERVSIQQGFPERLAQHSEEQVDGTPDRCDGGDVRGRRVIFNSLLQRNENACTECGIDNPVWFARSELWNLVMGGLDCTDDPGGFLCPVCFIRRAEAEGIVTTGWLLTTEEAAVAAEADNERLTAENANLRESAETAVFVANANTESLRIWQERYETLSLHHSAEAARADAAEARLTQAAALAGYCPRCRSTLGCVCPYRVDHATVDQARRQVIAHRVRP